MSQLPPLDGFAIPLWNGQRAVHVGGEVESSPSWDVSSLGAGMQTNLLRSSSRAFGCTQNRALRSLRRAVGGLSSRRVERMRCDISPWRCLDHDSAVAQLVGQLDQPKPERARAENPGREDDQGLDDDRAVGAVQGPPRVHRDSGRPTRCAVVVSGTRNQWHHPNLLEKVAGKLYVTAPR